MTLRVCMLVNSAAQVGGTELQAFSLARALRVRGVEVTFLVQRGDFSHLPTAEQAHLRLLVPPSARLPAVGAALTYTGRVLAYLFRHRREFDILHAHILLNGMMASLAGWLTGCPSLAKVASVGSMGEVARQKAAWLPGWRRRLICRLDGIVATTPQVRKEMEDYGYPPARIRDIPNGVDTSRFQPGQDSAASDGMRVICVSRFVIEKRLPLLVDAWALVRQELPLAQLVLVGDGPLRAVVQDRLRQMDLTESVILTGSLNQADLIPWLQKSQVFVLPSIAEGFSNAALEAMACGLPVVMKDDVGTRSVIRHGVSGVLLPEPVTPAGLAQALSALLKEPDRCRALGLEARRQARERFSIEAVADAHLRLYEDLLRTHRKVGGKGR